MKISIVTRSHGNAEYEFAKTLQTKLWKNHHVEILPLDYSWTGLIVSPLNQADLVVSVGGDGTLLQVVSKMQVQRPVVGVNFGGVGFLTDLEQHNAIEVITNLADTGDLDIENRMRIDVLLNGKVIGTALNEVAFKGGDYCSIVKYMVKIDDVVATEFKGDGLLISTPTGSTAYALSAGGSITDPLITSFLIVPIAPYLLSSRPQVVHGSRRLKVKAEDGVLLIDGRNTDYSCNEEFEFKVSEHPALFVDVGRNFFEKVNTKLKRL